MKPFAHFKRQCYREYLLQWRQPRRLWNSAIFFVMVLIFFPLAMPASLELLQTIAPGLVWIAVLLSILLASEGLFQQDYEEGVLEQWLLSGYALSSYVSAKLLVYWIFTVTTLLFFCPLLSLVFHLSAQVTSVLALSLLLSTPALLSLCFLAAAFSIARKQKGLLTALILLPLTLPLIIFGSATVIAAQQALPVQGYFAIQLAISLPAFVFLPFAIAAVLRFSVVSE
jgi:heme exporter protein B